MDKAEQDAKRLCDMPLDRPLYPNLIAALRARDEEIARLKAQEEQTVLAVKQIIAERAKLRAERDACVAALEEIDQQPNEMGMTEADEATQEHKHCWMLAHGTLAQLPRATERARLVDAVITKVHEALKEYDDGGNAALPSYRQQKSSAAAFFGHIAELRTLAVALDAHDQAGSGSEK